MSNIFPHGHLDMLHNSSTLLIRVHIGLFRIVVLNHEDHFLYSNVSNEMINLKSSEGRVLFLLSNVTSSKLGLYCACKTYYGAKSAGV